MRLGRDALPVLPNGVAVPTYLDDDIRVGIVHFGVGNFHRAHQASYLDRLLGVGLARDFAICGVGLFERDARMREAIVGQDGLYTLVLRHPNGSNDYSLIGSIRRFLYAPDEPEAVFEQLVSPDVRIVTLTITEGGYVCDPINGRAAEDDPLVVAEIGGGLEHPRTSFGWIVTALRERRRRGIPPFTVLSCDNIQGNGRVAKLSVEAVARLVDPDLADWIVDNVEFPSTMVDRITPATSQHDVDAVAAALGVRDDWPVGCEPFTQWIVEDRFSAGRPPLELAGVTFVEDIDAYEALKLRLLNGTHQAVAYIGQLAGYQLVHDACADQRISRFLHGYMELEAAPTVGVPDGFDLAAYMSEIFERFSNPQIRDRLDRLSVDASNRVPKFVLPVITDRLTAGHSAAWGAALIATWREYCRAAGNEKFTLDDAMAAELILAASGEPLDFLTGIATLAPLAARADFVEEYQRAAVLLAQGAADFLAELPAASTGDPVAPSNPAIG